MKCCNPYGVEHKNKQLKKARPLSAEDLKKSKAVFPNFDFKKDAVIYNDCRFKILNAYKLIALTKVRVAFVQRVAQSHQAQTSTVAPSATVSGASSAAGNASTTIGAAGTSAGTSSSAAGSASAVGTSQTSQVLSGSSSAAAGTVSAASDGAGSTAGGSKTADGTSGVASGSSGAGAHMVGSTDGGQEVSSGTNNASASGPSAALGVLRTVIDIGRGVLGAASELNLGGTSTNRDPDIQGDPEFEPMDTQEDNEAELDPARSLAPSAPPLALLYPILPEVDPTPGPSYVTGNLSKAVENNYEFETEYINNKRNESLYSI